jgi:signal transduction histidine kinase
VESDRLIEEARRLRFSEPGIEAAYQQDRTERGLARTRRVLAVLTVMLVGIGALLGVVAVIRAVDVPQRWLVFRFGMLAPAMAATLILTWSGWGRRHLQLVLGIGLAVAVGAFSLEWAVEWRPGMPLRGLWMIPLLTLWGCAMALPMSAKAVATMTLGVFVISTTGIAVYVQGLNAFEIGTALFVYCAAGYGILLFARWREIDGREAFVSRLENRILTEELRKRNETLVQANKLRDAFVEGVLHDIRSPLTAIFMSSTALRGERVIPRPDQGELVEGIVQAAKHIDTFVNRFLEQRSLDRADTPPAMLDVALDAAVDNVVTRARMTAVAKGQQIIVESFLPRATVRADELLFDRVLSNLLDNAIKYSPMDSTITLRVAEDPDVPGSARLAVTDQGPGIPLAEMERLFQPYSRLGTKTTGGEHSVGLGLSLVKGWIESMGGRVGCDSDPGRGATFWISIPRK